MTRPTRARIDLAALRHNYDVAHRYAAGAKLWAVIKANGYGHGALRIARGLADRADGYALMELETAIELREAGIRQPMLMMEGFYFTDELAAFDRHCLTPVVHRADQVQALLACGRKFPIYLKLNTGMNRLGLNTEELPAALDLLRGWDITLMTHFADADEPIGISDQMQHLDTICAGLPYPKSLANSAALLRFPESRADWVRPGIMLYGASPFPAKHRAADIGLRPVMSLQSELIAVRDIVAGDRVGYGGTFVADRPMRIGVVACGYADGYPRHAPTDTPILVAGQRTRTLGRVSMDKICVDLTDVDNAGLGSLVTLWGMDGNAELDADDVALSAGTVSYEMFCALARRVPITEIE